MYTIKQGETAIGTAEDVVFVYYGENDAYQECESASADGFCVKLPKETEMGTELIDTVFQLPGHKLRGDEPFGDAEYSTAKN